MKQYHAEVHELKNRNDSIKNWKGHKGTILDTIEEIDVIDCKTCGFNHIIPIPTQKELEGFYRDAIPKLVEIVEAPSVILCCYRLRFYFEFFLQCFPKFPERTITFHSSHSGFNIQQRRS